MKKRIITVVICLSCLLLLLGYTKQADGEEKYLDSMAVMMTLRQDVVSYPSDSQEALLKKLEQETSELVCEFFYEDFEGKGEYAAFVFTGSKKLEGSRTEFKGTLWYVDQNSCMVVEKGLESSTFNPKILDKGKERHLLFTDALSPSHSASYIWRIEDNAPLLAVKLPYFCYVSGQDIVVVKSFYSHSADKRIWPRYYLYWDEKSLLYQEYKREIILEEEFLSYEKECSTEPPRKR